MLPMARGEAPTAERAASASLQKGACHCSHQSRLSADQASSACMRTKGIAKLARHSSAKPTVGSPRRPSASLKAPRAFIFLLRAKGSNPTVALIGLWRAGFHFPVVTAAVKQLSPQACSPDCRNLHKSRREIHVGICTKRPITPMIIPCPVFPGSDADRFPFVFGRKDRQDSMRDGPQWTHVKELPHETRQTRLSRSRA